ncbi:hypothetical protein KIPB_014670 [Kipferlia bialata]|uniref:GOLD domain-containing protein n=1 Tax=Kipferlia bialata TaxID=797122 RepID=A0A391NX50_9EUKA|nr:hypothetical protein KIPB_014670 [Kipferlia bialata]|eukprot:g14670.t1
MRGFTTLLLLLVCASVAFGLGTTISGDRVHCFYEEIRTPGTEVFGSYTIEEDESDHVHLKITDPREVCTSVYSGCWLVYPLSKRRGQ